MKRVLWGEFEDGSDDRGPIQPHEIVLPSRKPDKLRKIEPPVDPEPEIVELKLENPLVTQTIEVMNQTEMLQTLIDTFSNKSGNNSYLLNPCQMIPQVDFPEENSANLIEDGKFTKPLWFIPPIETDFSRGMPQKYPKINQKVAKKALTKAIAGLSRIAGFNEASENTLILFTDAVEEYIRNLLQSMKQEQEIEMKDKSNILDIEIMEKGYRAISRNSLLSLHEYYKNEIIGKNIAGIQEFKEVYNEYDKLRKESQSMQKSEIKEEEINFLDIPGMLQGTSSNQRENVNVVHLGDGDGVVNVSVLDYFDNVDGVETSTTDQTTNVGASGSSFE